MHIYAGIDEAGYGPLLGPLLISRSVIAIDDAPDFSYDNLPDLWSILEGAVSRKLAGRKHRIPIGDSKKLVTKAAGIKHLETGVLCFARILKHWQDNDGTLSLANMLDHLGEQSHHQTDDLPWYDPSETHPWDILPAASTGGEIAIATNMLSKTMTSQGITLLDLAPALVLENRFNQMAAATRNKASTSFTFVAGHLHHIWQNYGAHHPIVAIDRQGGRTKYLRVLQINFPDASIRILDESKDRSAYLLSQQNRQMTVTFETKGEDKHFPIALASMLCKYLRELFMGRMNRYFQSHVPNLKHTAGYTQDGRRFLDDLRPHLSNIGIDEQDLIRIL
ncbi:hypothetical protein [Poriferisphaera sp. WC338]|uniref:hypothetical protein n=1 Tax=Poriferisphaera sp. WC338 TaxID=3425129 RepID=UPI003D818AD2